MRIAITDCSYTRMRVHAHNALTGCSYNYAPTLYPKGASTPQFRAPPMIPVRGRHYRELSTTRRSRSAAPHLTTLRSGREGCS